MQRTLTFTMNKKKYVSKPYDFETACKIDDARYGGEKSGPLNICRNAVDYMFEGTEATQDVIDSLDTAIRARLCVTVWKWYIDDLTAKNVEAPEEIGEKNTTEN